jgi:hypothetical protein
MKDWIVEVLIEAKPVLTIGSDFLGGISSLTLEDEEIIREAAKSLLAFVGESPNKKLEMDCAHNWVSGDNEVVSGVEVCTKCKEFRATTQL